MDIRFNEAQLAFRREVRAFIDEKLPQDIRARLRQGHGPRPQDTIVWHRLLNERGWAVPHWPREYGGSDLGVIERLILQDELYRAPAPMPLVFNVAMLGPVLLHFGTPEQKAKFLPKLANLDLWFCQGFSEPGSGSDLASLRTSARREGDHYRVNGQKIWTTTAHVADWIFCLVRTASGPRKQEGISFLLIDMRSPGITVRPIISIDGSHHFNEVFFDDVKVPADQLVGEEGRGWDCAKYLLASERTGIAGVGWCYERLQHATLLAASIRQAGRPLLHDPLIRTEIATLTAQVRALEMTNWRFLTRPSGEDDGAAASVLKLAGTTLQQDISALLARLAGRQGLVRRPPDAQHWAAAPVPRYLYLRAASIYGGSNEIQRDIVAKISLG